MRPERLSLKTLLDNLGCARLLTAARTTLRTDTARRGTAPGVSEHQPPVVSCVERF